MKMPHRTIFKVLVWISALFHQCLSQENQFQSCYTTDDIPQRCEPPPETFSLNVIPVVSSTCGSPPTDFCERTYSVSLDQISSEDCSYTCDSSDPQNSHGPELMTDFFSKGTKTWWQSESGIHRPQTVSIQIDLETEVQVNTILFQFFSFRPDAFYILRSDDYGNTFEPFNYFAKDCLDQYMINPVVNLDPENETQVLCQTISNPSPGQVTFVPSLDRPSDNDTIPGLSRSLYAFSTVTNIRVILDGHYLFSSLNESDYYYALEDLSVVGKCQCNGHADECVREGDERTCVCQHNTNGSRCERCSDLYNDLEWDITNGDGPFECQRCKCNGHAVQCVFNQTVFQWSGGVSGGVCNNCSDNTEGIHCDQCMEYFYPNTDLPINSSEYCQACNCTSAGIVDEGKCQRFQNESIQFGQCSCKSKVQGRACDQCMPGYYNLQPSNVDGCQDCNCSVNLSNGACNNITGECLCKPNVIGDRCDTCAAGYYLSNSTTCSPCNCDVGGALSSVCDVNTGQCLCRTGVTGLTCSDIEENRFFPFIDHFIYEAEESNGLYEFSYRLPNSNINNAHTGSGYVLIKNNDDVINFGQFTPPVGGAYEFVVRYRLTQILIWERVELRLNFNASEKGLGPPSGCSELNIPSDTMLYEGLPMGAIQAMTQEVCLRGGRAYSIVLNGFNSGSSANIELEVDSMVVLPRQPDNLASLMGSTNYIQCVENFRSLTTRGSSLTDCRDISFSVFTEMLNGTLACDCDQQGAYLTQPPCAEYGGQCDCKTLYNIGRRCDICAAGSYNEPDDNDGCANCACSTDGSIDQFCERFGGNCTCLPDVVGRTCDSCSKNHYNLTAGVGCEPCQCNEQGSKDLQCDGDDGVCDCRDGVGGEKCDLCLPVNFNFPTCGECNCSEAGSLQLSCHIDNGQCSCREDTEGITCDICSQGTFNLHLSNPEGCQPCYCSGVSTSCSSAPGFVAEQISTSFVGTHDWIVESNSDGYAQLVEDPLNDGAMVDTNTTAYLIAPSNYLGNKLSSYRQYLYVNVDIGDTAGNSSEGYDVVVESKEYRLLGRFAEETTVGKQTLQVRFYESAGWTHSHTNLPVSANQLQSTLIALTRLQVRVSVGSNVVISSISLDSTAPGNESEVGWVEQCDCIYSNYTGLSCEQCADGYTRTDSGLCVLCECNGQSSTCNKVTGVCDNCQGNTTGDNCEMCLSGYYGNPTLDIPCLSCMCPFSESNGQYSPSCKLQGGNILCTECQEGHVGDQCQTCDVGYFGDPMGLNGESTKCTNCSCNNNIDLKDPTSCDKVTGICLKCLNNTSGDECEKCEDGFYGDPIIAKNCTDCSCDSVGSNSTQCNGSGVCDCLSNVIGDKCNECAPLHYGFSSGEGCSPCNCNPVGSIALGGLYPCNITTGECNCKEYVTGRLCDQCEFGYYDLTVDGCKECGCGTGSSSPQCLEDGNCNCSSYVFMGEKCDRCIENYFINNDTQCEVCPSCYVELQADTNATRMYYSQLRKKVNAVAERNDPHETFEDKKSFALSEARSLDADVSSLDSQFGKLHEDVDDLYDLADQLEAEAVARNSEIEDAQKSVSPYEALARASGGIVTDLKKELYAGKAILEEIKTVIFPNIENNTSFIENQTIMSNDSLNQAMAYVEILGNQTNRILTLASLADKAANVSLSTANSLLTLSTDNHYTVYQVLSAAKELDANISFALQELGVLNLTVLHNHVSLLNLRDSLPVIPSEDFIEAQLYNATWLENRLNGLSTDYYTELELFRSLNTLLANLKAKYNTITDLLNQTVGQIDWYMIQLEYTYNETSEASSSAQDSIANAKTILDDLKNFSSAISALKMKADEALETAEEINRTVLMVEEVVSESLVWLESIREELDLVQPQSIVVNSNSTDLKETSGKLLNDSKALVEETDQLLNTYNINQATVDQLYSSTVSACGDIANVESTANETFKVVYSSEVQDLSEKAAALSANASSTVSQLFAALLTSPSVDDILLEEVENFVLTVENEISLKNISSIYEQLLALYNQQDIQLQELNSEISSIEKRVTRLKQIMASLPSDCDSNV